jgi:A/G-specific adenine glycosylase
MLGGMAALPGPEWSSEAAPPHSETRGTVRHLFTHFAHDLRVERRTQPSGEGWWHSLDALDAAGLPTLYRRAADLALAAPDRVRAAA